MERSSRPARAVKHEEAQATLAEMSACCSSSQTPRCQRRQQQREARTELCNPIRWHGASPVYQGHRVPCARGKKRAGKVEEAFLKRIEQRQCGCCLGGRWGVLLALQRAAALPGRVSRGAAVKCQPAECGRVAVGVIISATTDEAATGAGRQATLKEVGRKAAHRLRSPRALSLPPAVLPSALPMRRNGSQSLHNLLN